METILDFYAKSYFFSFLDMRSPWYNGRVLDFGAKGCGFESCCRHSFFLSNRSFYAKFRSNLGHKIINCTFSRTFANLGCIWMKSIG